MSRKIRTGDTMKIGNILLVLVAAMTITGQAPQRGQGGRGVGAQLPSSPVAATMPTFKEVKGPGDMFSGLQRLPADEDLNHFKYIVREYFVSGIAQGQPYTTRILVRRPSDV